ncbi:MAG: YqaJ viral recombinase family protein [Flavobacteriales bacterium]
MNALVPNLSTMPDPLNPDALNPQPSVVRLQRPIRFASTKQLSREEWLQLRKQGIGSSDAAAAVGLNPYQSMLELWLVKTGRDQDLPKPDFEDDGSPLYWGNILEPIVAQHYSQRTGHKVRRVNAILQHPEPALSWMLANLDYRVSADRSNPSSKPVNILECKTAGEYGARLWQHGVPEYVQLQVQHQLAVTGEQAADVCVLICGQRLQIYRIERDDELIARLIELEQQFWHYVETDTAPPADGSASAQAALRALYPQDAGTVLDLSTESELNHSFDQLLQLRQQIEQAEQQQEQLKQHLQQRMGDASQAVFARGSVSWKRSKDSLSLDSKRLLKEQPQLIEQYPLHKAGSRRFLVQVNS